MQLRATYQPIEYIENKVNELFPNMEAIVCISKNDSGYRISSNFDLIPVSTDEAVIIQKWRSRPVNFSWVKPSEFPWVSNDTEFKSQLLITDEFENRLLLLYFLDEFDKLKNIVALKFPRNTKFFGLQKELANFTTDEKQLVGETLHQLLYKEYRQVTKERKSLERINRFNQLKNDQILFKSTHSQFERFFHATCTKIISEIELNSNVRVQLNDACFAYLASHVSDVESLQVLLQEATELALMINPMNSILTLEELHFETILSEQKQQTLSPIKDQKTIELLDRYEAAAFKAQNAGYEVNGKNVAKFCNPIVSPPAITDAIKKQLPKIEIALAQHPSQWQLIRKSLKPLREIDGFKPLKVSNF